METLRCLILGSGPAGYTAAIAKVAAQKSAVVPGAYGCPGFDTFGPFKLIGGIAKGHPNPEDLEGTVRFYAGMAEQT